MALLVFDTAEPLSRRGRPSSSDRDVVRRPETQVSRKPLSGSRPNFMGLPIHHISRPLFVPLDYVSIAQEIKIRPPSAVRRPSVASFISEPIAWMFSNFICCLHWAICLDFFFDFF